MVAVFIAPQLSQDLDSDLEQVWRLMGISKICHLPLLDPAHHPGRRCDECK
jgi:hypothetical protein